MKHTATPWYRDEDGFIAAGSSDTYVTVADANCSDIDIDEREANTDFIIKACNNHYELLEALKQLEDVISGIEAEADNLGVDLSEARYWWVKAQAIINKAESATPQAVKLYDAYEIHGCCDGVDSNGEKFTEQCGDDFAMFWSLYGHIPGEGVQCIGDFDSREAAELVYKRITGKDYK
jgi:hypothetical protein